MQFSLIEGERDVSFAIGKQETFNFGTMKVLGTIKNKPNLQMFYYRVFVFQTGFVDGGFE